MKECYKPKTSDEIQKASEEYILKTHIDDANVQDHFIAGAECMKERMIEKAAKFIYDTIFNWADDSYHQTFSECRIDYINKFKKAMEE